MKTLAIVAKAKGLFSRPLFLEAHGGRMPPMSLGLGEGRGDRLPLSQTSKKKKKKNFFFFNKKKQMKKKIGPR